MSLTLSKIKLGPDLDTGLREALAKGEAVAFYFAAESREIALMIHNHEVVGDDIHPDEREPQPPVGLRSNCLACGHYLNDHGIDDADSGIGHRGPCHACGCRRYV